MFVLNLLGTFKSFSSSKNNMKKIVFISRKFPPSVGGMQKHNYELHKALSKYFDVGLISMGKKQYNLFWFLPYSFLKTLFNFNKSDVILGDGLLAPIGYLIKKFTGKKVYCVVHGLDVTYNGYFYQSFIPKYLSKLDKLICVSNNTIEECVKKGIERSKCHFIPNGVNFNEINISEDESRGFIEKKFDLDLKNKKVIITVGRLRKRKGVYWFLKNVVNNIKGDFVYLIIGNGNDENRIRSVLNDKSKLLTNVNDKDKEHIYNIADVFVMPNIKVEGDVEGFGIVAIEAAILGVPIIASNMEGIKEAIFDGKNGFLVNSMDVNGFVDKIDEVFNMKSLEKFRKNQIKFTNEKFNWEKLGKEYFDLLS
ncbi:MAG: hypothetical protein CMH62_00605 [Nanoarchaeota archaeon]|nr:hypothetical protein [Nanoarchaeota archaeon]